LSSLEHPLKIRPPNIQRPRLRKLLTISAHTAQKGG
jgi:hypothetical protein